MSDDYYDYDIAQVCKNGHVANAKSRTHPENDKNFCEECGAPTISHCPKCENPIRGALVDAEIYRYEPPKFCADCGAKFPWTDAAINAAKELARELESLDENDQAMLEKSIDDLIQDSPATTLAVERFRKLMVKAGQGAASMFREILVDVLSEAARKALWP